MKELLNQRLETEETSQSQTSFDALSENSEENWRKMQEAREQAERERIEARNEKMGESVIELDYHHNPDNSIIVPKEQEILEETTAQELVKTPEEIRRNIEDAINKTFLPMPDILNMLEQGIDGATKDTVTYNGKEIPIYSTGNLDFRFLQHAINFNHGHTSLSIDPSKWDKYNEENAWANGQSNMLSMYYRSCTGTREDGTHLTLSIRYGMLHMPEDSLRTITQNFTNRKIDTGTINLEDQRDADPTELVEEMVNSAYELQSFRYNKEGRPAFRPDFIIAPISGIDEPTKRQAEYFDVPIFMIPTQHVETEEDRAEKAQAEAAERQLQIEAINRQIEQFIQGRLEKERASGNTEEGIARIERNLRTLSSSSSDEVWNQVRFSRNKYATLYQLVQQRNNLQSLE